MAWNLAALAMVMAMSSAAWAQEVKFSEPQLNFMDAHPIEWAPKAPVPEFGLRAAGARASTPGHLRARVHE